MNNRDLEFARIAQALGFAPDGEIKVGGNYLPVVRHGDMAYVSGQVPRIGDTVVVTGRAGADASLEDARQGARICALRVLALLQRSFGSLGAVAAVLRMTVIVQCTDDFTQHSEVADAASELLHAVLGPAGVHSRTSLGACQLPKNATVELDLIAAAAPAP